MITNVTVHGICKIQRTGSLGQLENVSTRRKDVHLIGEQVDLDVLNELQRVAGALLHFQQALNPLPRSGVGNTRPRFLAFIEPVSGDAVVGHIFHFVGSDLDFNGHAVHALQHGVQRLVTVCLGNGDVVLELSGYRLIEAVHHAQRAIAIIDRVDE